MTATKTGEVKVSNKHSVRKYKFSESELQDFADYEEEVPSWFEYRGVVFAREKQNALYSQENYSSYEVKKSTVNGIARFQTFVLRADLLNAVDRAIEVRVA